MRQNMEKPKIQEISKRNGLWTFPLQHTNALGVCLSDVNRDSVWTQRGFISKILWRTTDIGLQPRRIKAICSQTQIGVNIHCSNTQPRRHSDRLCRVQTITGWTRPARRTVDMDVSSGIRIEVGVVQEIDVQLQIHLHLFCLHCSITKMKTL